MHHILLKASTLAICLAASLPLHSETISQETKDLCNAKMGVAEFVYTHRDQMTKDQMMQVLENTWGGDWARERYASYVDMQRIIEDAYRKLGTEYRRECCTNPIIQTEMLREGRACLVDGF